MNLISNYPQVPLSPVNPATQAARRDNAVREVIKQPAQVEPFPKETGLAKEYEQPRAQSKEPRQRYLGHENTQTQTEARPATQSDVVDAVASDEQQGQQQGNHSSEQEQQGSQSEAKASQSQEAQEQAETQQQVQQLQSQDQEVRAHEQAHASVGGQHSSSPQFNYDIGPDGQQYAISGEVKIDIAPIAGDPRATIQKMRQVRAAALAPAEPSSQDLKVAAEANRQIATAQADLLSGDESRNTGTAYSKRRLTGAEQTEALQASANRTTDSEDSYTEAVMYQRNQVIANVYRASSHASLSANQITA